MNSRKDYHVKSIEIDFHLSFTHEAILPMEMFVFASNNHFIDVLNWKLKRDVRSKVIEEKY